MLQRIPAWMGCVTGTEARQRQEWPPTPLVGISLVLLSPLLLLSIFHSPCPGLGFSCAISSSSDNKQSPAVAPWREAAGGGFGNGLRGIRAVRMGFEMLWEVQLWPGGLLCMACAGCDGSSCLPVLPGIAPSSLHPCIPCALSVSTVGTCQPSPPGLAQPLRILLPKRSWKTSSQLSLFMKA